MTAGAISMNPSLRSARAPSDSCGLPLGGASAGAPVVTVSVLVLTVPLLSSRPGRYLLGGGSRDQALRLQGVAERALHRLQRALWVNAGGRRDQVRDVDGHDLVNGRLRPHARVL